MTNVRSAGDLKVKGEVMSTVNPQAVREAAGLSRAELAERLGLSAKSGRVTVSEIENRSDWSVSGLSKFIAAAGGTAVVTVTVNGEVLEWEL